MFKPSVLPENTYYVSVRCAHAVRFRFAFILDRAAPGVSFPRRQLLTVTFNTAHVVVKNNHSVATQSQNYVSRRLYDICIHGRIVSEFSSKSCSNLYHVSVHIIICVFILCRCSLISYNNSSHSA